MAQVILVLSGKGGVGKSTVSACLAASLVKLGKKALCIDADVGFRCLDLLFNVGTQVVYNWGDVIEGSCSGAAAVVSGENGADLLAAPSEYRETFTYDGFSGLLKSFDLDYDYIFIDAPAGSGEFHKMLARASDSVLLVVTPDPVCVRSAEIAVERALDVNEGLDTAMVINRFNRLEVVSGRQLKPDEIIDATHTRLIGVIPESDSVRLISNGENLTKYAGGAFMRTAKRLTGEHVPFREKDFYN